MDNIEEIAKQVLQRPEYFMDWSDLDDTVWGRMFGRSRDSDLIEESNWSVICEEMEKYEHDWTTETASHWAVGWVEYGRVRVYDKQGNYTAGFLHCVEISERLSEYPLLDEEDFSRREFEEAWEQVENNLTYFTNRFEDQDLLPDDFIQRVWDTRLIEYDNEGVSDKNMEEAVEEAYVRWKLEAYEDKEQMELVEKS